MARVETKIYSETEQGIMSLTESAKASRYDWLQSLFKSRVGQNHLILLLGTPDPDAISSALALSQLSSEYDIESTILCFAQVSHHENKALVKKLGLSLQKYSSDFDLSTFNFYSIVDSQKSQTPIDSKLEDNQIEFLAFIDHHKEELSGISAQFIDVRPHYACTASIMAEYLQCEYKAGLTPNDPNHVKLATALMHGIRSDTQKFTLASPEDYAAASFISPAVDHKVIEIIERKVLTPAVLDMFENALVNRRIHDNFIFSDVGYVRETDRDGIPQIADLLLTREGTDTVLVFGVVEESVIDGSLRTRSETINPDEFLKGFLGVSPENGRPYGGGNIKDRGGFQIPLGFFSMHDDKSQIYLMAKQIVEKSFLDYIGKTGAKSRKKI